MTQITADKNIKDQETYKILGAAMAVHCELGHGFLEAIYHEALEQEFHLQDIPFSKEKKLPVYYKKHKLKTFYLPDFICVFNLR
ncbi:MAG: GxxExxY protein [Gammaproteobacteria bacterium]|nr:GxxExxY protein [Gammaproteobacteria bacterium]